MDNEEHNYLLIHTLQGRIDVLSYVEAECIKKWDGELLVYPKNEVEQVFYDELVENGYMVRCREEENNLVEHMMMNCRQKHYKMMTEKHRVVFVITYEGSVLYYDAEGVIKCKRLLNQNKPKTATAPHKCCAGEKEGID